MQCRFAATDHQRTDADKILSGFLVLGFQLAIFVVKVVERSPVGVGDDVAVGAEDVKVAEAADGPLPSEHFSASEVKPRSRRGAGGHGSLTW